MRRVFLFLILATLASWGCHKKPAVIIPPAAPAKVNPPVPKAVTPPPAIPLEPAPIEKTLTSPPSNLELGDMNFQLGNYQLAMREYSAALKNNPNAKNRDRILYQLALSRALSGDSNRDWRLAEITLRRLVAEFPKSAYKDQAELILGLQAQIERLRTDVKERDEKIKKLNEELQVLKDIDLQRRPSRPKE